MTFTVKVTPFTGQHLYSHGLRLADRPFLVDGWPGDCRFVSANAHVALAANHGARVSGTVGAFAEGRWDVLHGESAQAVVFGAGWNSTKPESVFEKQGWFLRTCEESS